MGRPKWEMRKIHRKRLRKAREKLKLYDEGKIPRDKLPKLSRKILQKRRKASKEKLEVKKVS